MTKVFIADNSAVVRSVIKEILRKTQRLQAAGEAASFSELQEAVRHSPPELLIADTTMFSRSDLHQLEKLCNSLPLPALLYHQRGGMSITGIRISASLEKPEFIKFSSQQMESYAQELEQLAGEIKQSMLFSKHAAVQAGCTGHCVPASIRHTYKAVLVGVSTGGPSAIAELLQSLGRGFPLPLLITQHIDSFFDKNLINWLNTETGLPVHLAEDGMQPLAGHVYFAPSDEHLAFETDLGNNFLIRLNHDPAVNFLRPSVDKMLESAASILGGNCIAVILTGMGADGAKGCRHIRELGGYTITQDEASCTVYGMPKAAFEAGGSCEVLPLGSIAARLWELSGRQRNGG